MTAEPKAQRMRDALDLLVARAEEEVGRARARVSALVKDLAADVGALQERLRVEGADAADAVWVLSHARELAVAQAELAARKERLRELQGVVEFAERTAERV